MLDLKKPFRLGDWTVEPGRLAIECGGEERHLEPKAMEMLAFLAEHAGETVSRDVLGREIWAGTHGSDEAISRIVSLLRSHLGDNSRKPRYIETIPKLGYRLAIHPQPLDRKPGTALLKRFSRRVVGTVVLLLLVGLLLSVIIQSRAPVIVDTVQPDPPVFTIAVRPLTDVGGTSANQFVTVGLTEEIINDLSQSPVLRIVSRNSTVDRPPVGEDGGIDYFLEGSVAIVDDRLRVHLEIIDGKEDIIQWSDNYVTVRSNYQEIQRELSELVISALNRVIGIETELPQREEVDLVAYTDYLNGIFFSKLRGEQPLRASIEAFNSALARQPEFQNARVALAHVLALLPFYSEQDEIRAFAEATRQLDALNGAAFAEAEAIRGFIAFRQWYWLQAEAHFIESLQANPNLANTHLWYSQFLSTVGRLEESLQQARMAYELDAVSPVVNDRLATAYLWLDQDEEALRRFATGASLGFDSFQNPGFLILLWRDRDYEQIRAGLRALHPGADLDPLLDNLEYLDVPDARTELVSMVDRLVLQQQLIPRLEFGVWIVLEQWERAVATIEKYSETKKNLDIEFLFAREAAGLREDPLFAEVTGRLGLENYWRNAVPSDFR